MLDWRSSAISEKLNDRDRKSFRCDSRQLVISGDIEDFRYGTPGRIRPRSPGFLPDL
ncbi:hypothetical protein [Tychonema sp. LEGE 07203]|uniref:hypothetical protein n=1 Tax=Tychonema sp. LEGE 07203 TaxID=1828671 RepID=UPI001882774E|nr:hypothetical protein [Tychonema sp. LEGE 07203]